MDASIGKVDILLHRTDESINERDRDGNSCMTLTASSSTSSNIATSLIQEGANINLQDSGGRTALIWAAWTNNIELARLFVQSGAALDICDNYDQETALMYATRGGHTEIVRLLLDSDADSNIRTANGATALILAIMEGNSNIVELLLEYGANVNTQDHVELRTPLIWATTRSLLPITQILIEVGADTSLRDKWGYTALHYAARDGHLDILKTLLTSPQCRANIDLLSKANMTALQLSVHKNQASIAICLVHNGSDPWCIDEWHSARDSEILHIVENSWKQRVVTMLSVLKRFRTKDNLFSRLKYENNDVWIYLLNYLK